MWYFAWYLRNLSFISCERDFKFQREGGVASWKKHLLRFPYSHRGTALKSLDPSKTGSFIFNFPQIFGEPFVFAQSPLYVSHLPLCPQIHSLPFPALVWTLGGWYLKTTFSVGYSQWEAMAGEENARVFLSLFFSLLWTMYPEVTVSPPCSLLLLSYDHCVSSSP